MLATSPAFARSAAFAVGEEQCLCVDINCHSKSITVPVTVVLGLAAAPKLPQATRGNPRQMNFFPINPQISGRGTCPSVRTGRHFRGRLELHRSRRTLNDEEKPALRVDVKSNQIPTYYRALFQAWGPQNWWPASTRFEVIVGAYLTQNTAWTNVEKALANLRSARVLSVKGIRQIPLAKLERLIRPSGYFRQKAQRLKTFVDFLDQQYSGSLARMFAKPTEELREELLNLNGIGPETADSILLYAGNHPVFVVDAYTRRILSRHAILRDEAGYEDVRKLFEKSLSPMAESAADSDESPTQQLAAGLTGAPHAPSPMSAAKRTALTQIYNEMHGLIVGVGKNYCNKSQPRCDGCPLQAFLPELK
jgi:endonuclease III related protein